MAEEEDSKASSSRRPPFLEVECKSSGKTNRFAAGTRAGFAVSLMNRKVGVGAPHAMYIEAVKEGEEPVSFGPDAPLVDYGNGWKLRTFNDSDFGAPGRSGRVGPVPRPMFNGTTVDGSHPAKAVAKPAINFLYIAKILVAFIFIFVLGAIFTLALEGLPKLINFVNGLM